MGCGSSQEIDQDNAVKVILLGAAGSGKSTFFKQLQLNFGTGYTEQQRRSFRGKIFEQVIGNVRLLIRKKNEKLRQDEDGWARLQLGEEAAALEEELSQTATTTPIDAGLAAKIQTFWRDAGVQFAFENRAKFCLTESTDFFIQKLDQVAAPDYLPTDEDLVLTRFATGGMDEASFVLNGSPMTIMDVGGQRAERRKWNLYPDDSVSAAIFVTSLSSFDETLIEDMKTNVMFESFQVFKSAWEAEWAEKLNFILFLNKEDLFMEKMDRLKTGDAAAADAGGPIGFAEAWGDEFTDDPLDVEACKDFMKRKYASVIQGDPNNPQTKQVYIHVTTATDARNVQNVFNDVQHIIIDASLSRSFLN